MPDVLTFGGRGARSASAALRDIVDGLRQYRYWHESAVNDVRARYRRTAIGEFWISLNLLVFVVAIGFFYGLLLHLSIRTYLPYLLVGYAFWLLLSSILVEGAQTFIMHGGILRQRRTPLTTLVLRTVDRAFLTFVHNLAVVVVSILVLGVRPTPEWAALVPALIIWWLNAVWLAFALAILCARFRDVLAAISSLMQLIFLLSPILWQPKDLPAQLQVISQFNPITHFLTIVRNPLLNREVPLSAWIVVAAITVAGWGLVVLLLRSYRSRVVYWV